MIVVGELAVGLGGGVISPTTLPLLVITMVVVCSCDGMVVRSPGVATPRVLSCLVSNAYVSMVGGSGSPCVVTFSLSKLALSSSFSFWSIFVTSSFAWALP